MTVPKTKKFITVLAVSTLLTLTGCAQIPRDSAIQSISQADLLDNFDYVYYNPSGPSRGQTPTETIQGFLSAGTGPQNDYSVAREFLTNNHVASWNPSQEVLIQRGRPEIQIVDDNLARVTVVVDASVTANGTYQQFEKPQRRILDYQLKQENGQWRISAAPNLTVLNRSVFDVLFSSYSVYFFDHATQYLVPDVRWFPDRASTATRLVNALLEGPSSWLAPAVNLPLPAKTKLAIDSVTVVNSVAQVNLSAEATAAKPQQLREFRQQLVATLSQLPKVTDVNLLIAGTAQNPLPMNPQQPQPSVAQPIAISNGQLLNGEDGTTSQLQSAQNLVKEFEASNFAITANLRDLAILGRGGLMWTRLGQIDRNLKVIDAREGLLNPVFDTSNALWSIGRNPYSAVLVVSQDGKASSVAAPWLGGRTRLSFSLSQEGSRALMLTRSSKRNELLVMSVVRDSSGVPIEFSQPVEITRSGMTVVDATWAGQNKVALLLKDSDETMSVQIQTIGGGSEVIGPIDASHQILAANDGSDLYVVTDQNRLLNYSGIRWNMLLTGVKAAQLPR